MPQQQWSATPRLAVIRPRKEKMTSSEDKYSDIIDLPHHRSEKHPAMPLSDRAAQFAPFAALTGFDEKIGGAADAFDGRTETYEEDPENDIYKEITND